MDRYLPNYLIYLIRIFFLNIIVFFMFRVIFFTVHYSLNAPHQFTEILYAFLNRGIMFDQKISAIMIAVPFLFLSLLYLVNLRSKFLEKFFHVYLCLLIFINIFILVLDIPYFSFYSSRLTRVIFNWMATPDLVIDFVFSTPFTILAFVLMLVLLFFSVKLLNKIFYASYTHDSKIKYSLIKRGVFSFVFLVLLALGIRGEYKFDSHPFVIKDAYFSKNVFVNQLSINPIFSFFDSFRYKIPDFFKDKQVAIEIVKEEMGFKDTPFKNPLARKVNFSGRAEKYNVILIFLESLSRDKMGVLTPELNKLTQESLYFSNFYATGQHTFAGLYSTYTGQPIICGKNPMYDTNSSSLKYSSMISVLTQNDYATSFFCTGKAKFDNMHTFFTNNDMDEIYEEKDFPRTKFKNNNGVYDHVLFDFALTKIDNFVKNDQPFFTSLLTISTHKWNPLIDMQEIGFIPKAKKAEDIIYEYADWALGRFMKEVKTKPWFNNTLFIILGDHGQVFSEIKTYYPIPLSYHRVPLLFYAPKIFDKPKIDAKLASQVDIFPTLMSILKIPYVDRTFGVNLFKGKREYVYISADGLEGVLNEEYFFITKPKEQRFLYKYNNNDPRNYLDDQPEISKEMERKLLANLETAQYLISNRLIGDEEDFLS
ncbi:MAG: sulfatase-like hydrolase/transferase [bacterium]|nr:sulfatase-like hydrolase/transferase [bacterium]